MESTVIIFISFILLSVVAALLLFNYFKSRRTHHSLVKPISNQTPAGVGHANSGINFSKVNAQRFINSDFLLNKEEKEPGSDLNPFDLNDPNQFIVMKLSDYISTHLNTNELIKAKSFSSIPLDDSISESQFNRLKKYELVDKDRYFSERGFTLLCIIARFMKTDGFKKYLISYNTKNHNINN